MARINCIWYYYIRKFSSQGGFGESMLRENENVIGIKGFRKSNLPYIFIWIIYYAWVIVFSTWWTASPFTGNASASQFRVLLHIVNLVSSGFFILIIQKKWFVKTAHASAVLLVMVMITYLSVKDTRVQFVSVITFGILLGVMNISILIPFVFNLNNTEKLYAVVGSNLLINIISLFNEIKLSDYLSSNNYMLISFIIMAIALSSTIFFKDTWLSSRDYIKADIWHFIHCLFYGKHILHIII